MEGVSCRGVYRSLQAALDSRSNRPKRFRPVNSAAPSTIEEPVTVPSNWAYFTAATGTAYTVPANAAITFNGVDWITANGTTPAGAKRWKVRGLASDQYETLVTYTPTLGGVNYPFVITTMAEPQVHFDELSEAQFGALTEEQLDALNE